MRLNFILLVATLAHFASINASSTRSSLTVGKSVTSDQKDDVPAQRFLRVGAVTNEEERAINPSGVDDAATFVESMKSKVLEKMLLWTLRASGKSADDAFNFLRLHKAGEKLVSSPRYKAWLKYVAKAPDTTLESVITTVHRHYGDEGLVDMLEAFAKRNAKEAVVARVESALMSIWKGQGKSAKGVFTRLLELKQSELDQPSGRLLRQALLNAWVKYVRIAASKPDAAMLQVIVEYDEKMRLMILEGLRNIKGTKVVVTELQESLYKGWYRQRKSAVSAFATLGLDKVDDKWSSEANLKMWLEYVVTVEPNGVSESMVTVVAKRFGDKGLVDMLEAFAKSNAKEVVVARVESALMSIWKGQGKSAKDVFKMLLELKQSKFNQPSDHLLRQKMLNLWSKYAKSFPVTDKAKK